jgi:hypothetical protein
MMQLKADVKVKGLQPEILLAIMVAKEVYADAGQTFTITSICDGKHSDASLHYKGQAVDIRTRDLSGVTALDIASRIKIRLGGDYDVVVEGDHIHVEFQPKE